MPKERRLTCLKVYLTNQECSSFRKVTDRCGYWDDEAREGVTLSDALRLSVLQWISRGPVGDVEELTRTHLRQLSVRRGVRACGGI